MTRLTSLYPRRWRDRYGDELADLLDDRPLSWSDRLDLLRGVLDAHRHPELVDPTVATPALAREPVSPRRLADLRVARRLGIGAMAGAIAWFAAWIVSSMGPIVQDVGYSYRDGSAAMPLYMVAMWVLAAGFVGHIIRLPSRAVVARLAAFIAAVAFGLYSFGPWLMPFAVVGLGGLVVLAATAWWAGHWSGLSASIAVAVSAVGAWQVWLGLSGQAGPTLDPAPATIVGIVLFGWLWLVIGATLLRLPPVDEGLGLDDLEGSPATA